MALHQINVGHVPEQDRLLVRISTTEKLEFRFWLTRNLVRGLWDGLLKLMQHAAPVQQQAAEQTKAAVLGFEHEKALSESRFGEKYLGEDLKPAMPGHPPLITAVQLGQAADGNHTLVFQPKSGGAINVQFNDRMLHAFSKLVRDAAIGADWDLPLTLPVGGPPPGGKVN